jgi:Na+/proline symporter
MHPADILILCLYAIAIVLGGLYFQRRSASDIDGFFLGGRKLPWWALGASGMAGNIDISGTMICTALVFALGTGGFFVELRGGIVLVMAFLMVFMGKWNRRGQVMTLAEWMRLRFGRGRPGDAARLVSAITSLMLTLALISFFALATGKFAAEFLNLDWRIAAVAMVTLAGFYTLASGLHAVVWIDVFQAGLILLICLIVVGLAIHTVPGIAADEMIQVPVPGAGGGGGLRTTTFGEWSALVPAGGFNFTGNYSTFNLFGLAVGFYFFKAMLEGFGGASSYMAQRYFASGSDREAGLTSLLWIALLSFRWPMTGAIALLGIHFISQENSIPDPELVLPTVLHAYLPVGIKGLVLAGFFAAALSTAAATVNAGAAYWVKDIYQGFLRPAAGERALMVQSRLATIALLVVGTGLSFLVRNMNEIWDLTMMGIASGLLVPQILRWYWPRYNGWGFAAGAAGGMATAICVKLAAPDVTGYTLFAAGNGAALATSIAVSLATRPTDPEVLRHFYQLTRPFGLWKRFRDELPAGQRAAVNRENRRDLIALCFAIPMQISLFLTGMMLVFRRWDSALMAGLCLALSCLGVWFFWFRHLTASADDPAK